jgi:iron complex transport system substrate-binding protein
LTRRIVSLTCSNTEIVCALGCADRLVGVDDHSDWPEAVVRALPRVGPDLGIDVARVAALKPDLVLASLTVPGHERIVAALAAAGLPHIAPEPIRLEDVYADIRLIGSKLGVPARAEALVASMRAELEGAPEPDAQRPRVLVEWWPKPVICPGRDSWVNQLLAAAGGVNPLAERAVKSQPLSDDEVCELAPEAVVISWCGVRPEKYRPDVVYRRPRWRELPALRERRVYCVPEAYLGRPGPRLVEGFRALRNVVAECRASTLTRGAGSPALRS